MLETAASLKASGCLVAEMEATCGLLTECWTLTESSCKVHVCVDLCKGYNKARGGWPSEIGQIRGPEMLVTLFFVDLLFS